MRYRLASRRKTDALATATLASDRPPIADMSQAISRISAQIRAIIR